MSKITSGWINEHWSFAIDYVKNYNLEEDNGAIIISLGIIEEMENCGGHIP